MTMVVNQVQVKAAKLLIGQNWENEFDDYVVSVGTNKLAGVSFYTDFFNPSSFAGSGQSFVATINNNTNYKGYYAELGLSWKQVYSQDSCNNVYQVCVDITKGKYDTQIDQLSQILSSYNNLQWLLRIEYEVSSYIFSYKYSTGCTDANEMNNPSNYDNDAYRYAYNYVANRIRVMNKVENVDFIYHPIRSFSDCTELYPNISNVDQDNFVDKIAFSVFNNDVCMPVDGVYNCNGSTIDPNLENSLKWAVKQKGSDSVYIAESSAQQPACNDSNDFTVFLQRVFAIVSDYSLWGWTYINENWCQHGWTCPPWGNSRVQDNSQVLEFWEEMIKHL